MMDKNTSSANIFRRALVYDIESRLCFSEDRRNRLKKEYTIMLMVDEDSRRRLYELLSNPYDFSQEEILGALNTTIDKCEIYGNNYIIRK
jgi:hypothetical protein